MEVGRGPGEAEPAQRVSQVLVRNLDFLLDPVRNTEGMEAEEGCNFVLFF